MPALPSAANFTGASVSEGQFKTELTTLLSYLNDLLGSAGTIPAAHTALGSLLNGVLAKTAAYTVVAADRGKLIDCTNTWTLTLTAAATLGAGFAIAVRNSGTGTITIDGNLSELVDGAATIALPAGESCVLSCTGTAWKSVGRTVALPAATASVNGYMTSTYAAKLDGVAAGANLGVGLDAQMGVGAICQLTTSAALTHLSTYAGSGLRPITVNGWDAFGNSPVISLGATQAGTWRFLGNTTGAAVNNTGIFQRIS